MQKLPKRTLALTVNILLLALTLWFIWGNSLASRAQSGTFSMSVSSWLDPFLNFTHLSAEAFDAIIRKAAHFTEFAVFGAEFWLLKELLGRKSFFFPAFCTLLAATLDEFWQTLRDRGPSVRDVLLDFSGAVFGMLCMMLLLWIIEKFRKNKKRRAEPC